MSKTQEALKLALEALEKMGRVMKQSPDTEKAITAIREALADSALDRMADNARELGLDYEPPCKTGSQCTSKCQQCEQPAQQQEPVAWGMLSAGGGFVVDCITPEEHARIEGGYTVPLYTSPPASKPWQGLVWGELPEDGHNHDFLRGAAWAEAKLREKNQ